VKNLSHIEKYKSSIVEHLQGIMVEDCPPTQMLNKHLFICLTSLRLSYWGFNIFKKHYISHSFELIDKDMICGALTAIEDRITAPYYISSKKFYLFGKTDAFMAILNDNDVMLMLRKASKWDD
jgi:hypothetical protein